MLDTNNGKNLLQMQNESKKNTLQNEKTRFVISLSIALFFILIMLIEIIIDETLNLNFYKYGVLPRTFTGLKGIILSPFIHGSFKHFFSNSLPFLVLLTGLLYFFPKKGFRILIIITIASNIIVWIIGRSSFHVGASGIIYGLASFIFFSGVISRRKEYIALSLIVVFLYGSLIWGIFPGADKSISWEAHLGGFSIGTILSLFYHPKKLILSDDIRTNIFTNYSYNFYCPLSSKKQKFYYFYTQINTQNQKYYIYYEKNYYKSSFNFNSYIFASSETTF